ncbi:P27 family phage terminase small subunit [Mechercharimyces sp. CAU 1602]|uniref:P27 family phage terminase small subunit n=1 Tax=Mechercharimyces sp. CAU 1602 TaxID=2973933 RepID=UPI0021624DD8|nr:P27 family phage terminase small subunit [Mechercharimyces sp. CAU 1602]MCS1351157.1 P27 family phage terminase small subunit [Mechercharimyces sp. CAU 1602]
MTGFKPSKNITIKAAKNLFHIVAGELEKEKMLNERTILIVENMALLEQVKERLLKDIKDRGVVEHFVNGTQEMWRENKSVDKVLKVVEGQRKLLNELCLTPSSAKKIDVEIDDGDDFDDY